MWNWIEGRWNWLKGLFDYSETLFWARVQIFVGVVWTVLSSTDLAPLLQPKYLTYWLIINGIVTEFLRRRGTEIRNGVLRSTDTVDKV